MRNAAVLLTMSTEHANQYLIRSLLTSEVFLGDDPFFLSGIIVRRFTLDFLFFVVSTAANNTLSSTSRLLKKNSCGIVSKIGEI